MGQCSGVAVCMKIFYKIIAHTANWKREYCFLGVCRLESQSSKAANSEFQAYKILAT